MPEPFYIVHNRIHEHWAKSRLTLWLVAFDAGYNEKTSRSSLEAVLREFGVVSYAVYELLEQFDMFARVWLPNSVTTNEFRAALENRLDRLARLSHFEVAEVRHHWVWMTAGYQQHQTPPAAVLAQVPSTSYLRRLNNTLAGPGGDTETLSPSEIDDAVDKHIIGSFLGHGPSDGLKFVLVIRSLRGDLLDPKQREEMSDLLTEGCRQLGGSTESFVTDLSLYLTPASPGGDFVVMGRLSASHFYEGLQQIFGMVNQTGFLSLFSARPYTYLSVNPYFALFSDGLPVDGVAAEAVPLKTEDIERLLSEPESATLEFKATMYADIRKFVFVGQLEKKDALFDEIIEGVAAFLNSPAGGRLLIGVLEASPLQKEIPTDRAGALDSFLADLPEVGDYHLVGLAPDRQVLSKSLQTLDALKRHVMERLETAIDIELSGHVDIDAVTIAGREILVVTVIPLPGSQWAYLSKGGAFYVRSGARSKILSGRDAGEYRDRNEPPGS